MVTKAHCLPPHCLKKTRNQGSQQCPLKGEVTELDQGGSSQAGDAQGKALLPFCISGVKKAVRAGVLTHTFNSSTVNADAGGSL